jgi:hypothetical protein
MKKTNLFLLLFLTLGITLALTTNAASFKGSLHSTDGDDTIVMGSAYVNDVYYSLNKGITATPPRATWDIAFRTGIMSSCILTNGVSGVMLYAYPKSDTSGWATLDTNGLYSWKPLYNSVKKWEDGAFMANAGKHPDYGWGVYNNTTHKLHGDSLFVIKLLNGTYRKIWIVQKDSPKNKYYVRYAKLDGTMDTTVMIDCNLYKTKEFVGFSVSSNSVVDREPLKTNWDLLFTKYMDKVSMGPGVYVDYPVMGILTNNVNVFITEVRGVNQQTYEDYKAHKFDSTDISVIGRDWKKSVGQPPVYSIVDTLVYFLYDTASGDVYKLYFKGFEDGSSSDGKVMFKTKLLKLNSIPENNVAANMMVYPNPATSSNINLVYRFDDVKEFTLDVIDINGSIISTQRIINKPGLNTVSIANKKMSKGFYIARISTGKNIISTRFVITE